MWSFRHCCRWPVILLGGSLCWAGAAEAQTGLYGSPPPVISTNATATPTDSRTTNHLGPASFALKPTAIAPAGAAGSAQVKPDGISLHLSRLGPGRYRVEGILAGDGSHEPLGTITILDPTASPDRQATDNKNEASANPDQVRVDTDVEVSAKIPGQGLKQVLVVDSGGNAVLASEARP